MGAPREGIWLLIFRRHPLVEGGCCGVWDRAWAHFCRAVHIFSARRSLVVVRFRRFLAVRYTFARGFREGALGVGVVVGLLVGIEFFALGNALRDDRLVVISTELMGRRQEPVGGTGASRARSFLREAAYVLPWVNRGAGTHLFVFGGGPALWIFLGAVFKLPIQRRTPRHRAVVEKLLAHELLRAAAEEVSGAGLTLVEGGGAQLPQREVRAALCASTLGGCGLLQLVLLVLKRA